MTILDAEIFRRMADSAPQGIVLVDAQDPGHPAVYVNPAFTVLTGYGADELLGRNLRLLQGPDREQEGRRRLVEAMGRGETCNVVMRNYRKDGTLFWNDFAVQPLPGADGKAAYFVGFHRDAGDKLRTDSKLARDALGSGGGPASLVRDDRLTGLFTQPYLHELLKRDWGIAQREQRSIAMFCIDIDALDLYNTTFGRAAGDSTIRRVAHCIAGCLRRASDATARVDGGSFVAFAPGLDLEHARRMGQLMAERVRDLRIHHPRCTVLRYVSISVGVAAAVPEPADTASDLLQKAYGQLRTAKSSGRNQAA